MLFDIKYFVLKVCPSCMQNFLISNLVITSKWLYKLIYFTENTEYGRQQISRCVQIVAPIQKLIFFYRPPHTHKPRSPPHKKNTHQPAPQKKIYLYIYIRKCQMFSHIAIFTLPLKQIGKCLYKQI